MLNNIQNLRAIAAYAVVLYHCLIRFGIPEGTLGARLVDELSGGVDLFFVISGFVMVHTTKPDESSLWFMSKRVARIVPLYWCATLLVIPLVMYRDWTFPNTSLEPQAILASLFFIPHPNTAGYAYPTLGVGWTLNYEMMFYVLFAVSMLLQVRYRLAGVVALISMVFIAANLSGNSFIRGFYGSPIVFEFAAGAIVAYALRLPKVAAFVKRVPMWPLALAGLAAIVLSAIDSPQELPSFFRIGLPAIAIVFAAAAQDMYRKPASETLLTRLGDASYSAYLLHPIILNIVVITIDKVIGAGAVTNSVEMIATIVATAIISMTSLRYFEKPTAKLVRKLSQRAGLKPPKSDRSKAAAGLTSLRVP